MRQSIFITSIILIVIAITVVLTRPSPEKPLEITLVTTNAPFSANIYLAEHLDLFTKVGLKVNLIERASGRLSLLDLMNGKSDFATAAETPIMFTLLKASPLQVIATLGLSQDNTLLIARHDRGIESNDDIKGHRIGFSPGTNSQYFLDTFLEYRELQPGDVERVPLKPEAMVDALTTGEVDGIVAWPPISDHAISALGENASELRVGNVYRWSWNLVARNSETANKIEAVRLLKALTRATDLLQQDPDGCAKLLSERMGLPPEKLSAAWKYTIFQVTLDQSLLLNLEQQARWAISAGLTDVKEVPNFLPAISSKALRKVNPDTVTIIDNEETP